MSQIHTYLPPSRPISVLKISSHRPLLCRSLGFENVQDDVARLFLYDWTGASVSDQGCCAAGSFIDRALLLNPNMAAGWLFSGWIRMYLGEPDLTVEHSARAIRLSPLDPFSFIASTLVAAGHFFAGRHDEASSWAEKGLREQANWAGAARVAAASHALAGRLDQAKKAMVRLRQIFPMLRVSDLRQIFPFRRPEDLARYEEALRKAGLPE